MKKFILVFYIFVFVFSLKAQDVREFRLGVWSVFPWVEPNQNEQDYATEINLNHMNAWILNPYDPVYSLYPTFYPNFSSSHIRWLESRWMDYFNTTHTTGENIGMYIGYNGWETQSQYDSQLERFSQNGGNTSTFRNTFSTYYNEFGNDVALQGYYVSHEDIQDTIRRQWVLDMCQYIRSQDSNPDHELVIEFWDPTEQNSGASPTKDWLIANRDNFDIYENTIYNYFVDTPYLTENEQSALTYTFHELNECMNIFNNSSTDWQPIIQTFAQLTAAEGGTDQFIMNEHGEFTTATLRR